MSEKYKEGMNRKQQQFFPPSLDEYVDENNQVRAIDLYVEQLDFKELGFDDTSNSLEGQKSYSPKLLLKIYIYGYLNKIRSSRALEKENARNIELMWLTQGLKPTYKTIADFRKNNPKALKEVFKDFYERFVLTISEELLFCRNSFFHIALFSAKEVKYNHFCARVLVETFVTYMSINHYLSTINCTHHVSNKYL